jgi:hypothetical protein
LPWIRYWNIRRSSPRSFLDPDVLGLLLGTDDHPREQVVREVLVVEPLGRLLELSLGQLPGTEARAVPEQLLRVAAAPVDVLEDVVDLVDPDVGVDLRLRHPVRHRGLLADRLQLAVVGRVGGELGLGGAEALGVVDGVLEPLAHLGDVVGLGHDELEVPAVVLQLPPLAPDRELLVGAVGDLRVQQRRGHPAQLVGALGRDRPGTAPRVRRVVGAPDPHVPTLAPRRRTRKRRVRSGSV